MKKILLSATLLLSLVLAPAARADFWKRLGRNVRDVVTLGEDGRERDRMRKEKERAEAEERARGEQRRKQDAIAATERDRVRIETNLHDLEEVSRLVGPAQELLPGLLESAKQGVVAQTQARSVLNRITDMWQNEGSFADQVFEILQNSRSKRIGQTEDTARVIEESRLAAAALGELQATAKAHRVTVAQLIEKASSTLEMSQAQTLRENLQVIVDNLRAANTYSQSRIQTLRKDLDQAQTQLKQLRA